MFGSMSEAPNYQCLHRIWIRIYLLEFSVVVRLLRMGSKKKRKEQLCFDWEEMSIGERKKRIDREIARVTGKWPKSLCKRVYLYQTPKLSLGDVAKLSGWTSRTLENWSGKENPSWSEQREEPETVIGAALVELTQTAKESFESQIRALTQQIRDESLAIGQERVAVTKHCDRLPKDYLEIGQIKSWADAQRVSQISKDLCSEGMKLWQMAIGIEHLDDAIRRVEEHAKGQGVVIDAEEI